MGVLGTIIGFAQADNCRVAAFIKVLEENVNER